MTMTDEQFKQWLDMQQEETRRHLDWMKSAYAEHLRVERVAYVQHLCESRNMQSRRQTLGEMRGTAAGLVAERAGR